MNDTTLQSDDNAGPSRAPSYELDELLERMTAETFPEIVDIGPTIGREVW
jgi:hypothetical protein